MTTSLQLPTNDQIKATTRAIWNHDYGASLRTIGRGLAIAIAITYVAGMALGAFVHQCNEQLRRFTAQFHEPSWHEQRLLEVRQRIANSITASEATPVTPAAKPARKRAARKPASSMPASSMPASSMPASSMPASSMPATAKPAAAAAAKPVSASASTRKRTAPGASRTSPAKGFVNA